MSLFILIAVILLAYSNGANDNFKGVATLFGSGTTDYRKALVWATSSTLAGSLFALVLAQGLVNAFKGKGLVPDAITAQPTFLLAVSLGAGLTILIATLTGLPVSTTHGLTGALVGAGLVATGGNIAWSALGTSFVVPLLCGPLVSMLLTLMVYPVFRRIRSATGVTLQSCVCIGPAPAMSLVTTDGCVSVPASTLVIQTGEAAECRQRYQGRMLGLEAGLVLDTLHYLSAGAVGFARGLNDTPKIVALLIGAQAVSPNIGLMVVALAMGIGGILNASRVAETMSKKITRMNPGQGLTANLVTALLVAVASRFSLPVSTTHVSVGSLFAIGTVNGTAQTRMVLTILLAWITTLPLGALMAASAYGLIFVIS
jgi:inorganic phosphate transporter, PiT family